MHETWQDLHRYLAPPLLRCTVYGMDYICSENLQGSKSRAALPPKHIQYPHAHIYKCTRTSINMHACFHEHRSQWQKHLLLYSWVSALSLEIYIFLTSPPRCHIVSHFAGSACEARRLLASKVKWAGPWVIDEAATILKISITKAEEPVEPQYNNTKSYGSPCEMVNVNGVQWFLQIGMQSCPPPPSSPPSISLCRKSLLYLAALCLHVFFVVVARIIPVMICQ